MSFLESRVPYRCDCLPYKMFRRDIGLHKRQPFSVQVLVLSFWFKEKHRTSLLVGGESQNHHSPLK